MKAFLKLCQDSHKAFHFYYCFEVSIDNETIVLKYLLTRLNNKTI